MTSFSREGKRQKGYYRIYKKKERKDGGKEREERRCEGNRGKGGKREEKRGKEKGKEKGKREGKREGKRGKKIKREKK